MIDKAQATKLVIGGFGAAMATVFAVPEVHATILPLHFTPGYVGVSATSRPGVKVKASTSVGGHGYFLQHNYHSDKGIKVDTGIQSMAEVAKSKVLNPSTFRGGSVVNFGGTFNTSSVAVAGTFYVGFRSKGGDVGWFTIDLGGDSNPVVYGRGFFGNAGESLVVGQLAVTTGVPEPTEWGMLSLGLLALGAAGVRRRRETRKAAGLN